MSTVEYLGDEPTLFLDISSTCTGWAVASMDRKTRKAKIKKAGVMWFHKDWDHGRKYKEIQDFILNVAYIQFRIQNIVAEGYMVNPKRAMGTLVIPEATGAVKACCYEAAIPLGFRTILPQSWRSALGIKKNKKIAGTKAWKEPTKEIIENILGKLPETVMNNITGKERATPYDLYDALGVCLGWLSREPNSCTEFVLEEGAIG